MVIAELSIPGLINFPKTLRSQYNPSPLVILGMSESDSLYLFDFVTIEPCSADPQPLLGWGLPVLWLLLHRHAYPAKLYSFVKTPWLAATHPPSLLLVDILILSPALDIDFKGGSAWDGHWPPWLSETALHTLTLEHPTSACSAS